MTDRPGPPGAGWVVLLPVKDLAHAKSRLEVPDRAALALAMLRDAVTAARGAAGVREVWLVTNDPDAAAAFSAGHGGIEAAGHGGIEAAGHGGIEAERAPRPARSLPPAAIRVVPDWPAAGLNAAVTYAAGLVEASSPVAVLAGDLPALRPEELTLALAAAGRHDRAIVTDAPGTGTVLLTSRHPAALQPAFGTGSRVLHVAAGAVDLSAELTGRVPGLQQDVDTAADLAAAIALGPGPATGALLAIGTDPAQRLCAPFGTIEP